MKRQQEIDEMKHRNRLFAIIVTRVLQVMTSTARCSTALQSDSTCITEYFYLRCLASAYSSGYGLRTASSYFSWRTNEHLTVEVKSKWVFGLSLVGYSVTNTAINTSMILYNVEVGYRIGLSC